MVESKMGRMNYAEEVKEYYSAWWKNPKDIRNVVFNSFHNYVKHRILTCSKPQKVLDIASGLGRTIYYLQEKGYDIIAMEFNEEFVAALRSKFPSVKAVS